jgi:ABC-2 type transport system permease protein
MGGCMQPLETFPVVMRTVAHVTPHAWAVDAFADVIRSGAGVVDIALELAVLAAYAAGLLAVASWQLRRALVGG